MEVVDCSGQVHLLRYLTKPQHRSQWRSVIVPLGVHYYTCRYSVLVGISASCKWQSLFGMNCITNRKVIFICSNNSPGRYVYMTSYPNWHGTTIMRQTQVKFLRITIDQKLKFDKNIDNLCKNAARQINIMYRFKGIFDLKEREIISLF